jgi:hypothetical protein
MGGEDRLDKACSSQRSGKTGQRKSGPRRHAISIPPSRVFWSGSAGSGRVRLLAGRFEPSWHQKLRHFIAGANQLNFDGS